MNASPPADDQTVMTIRESFRATDPNVAVGRVTSVIDDFVAVGDIPVEGFKEGDAITLIDSARQPIASAMVKSVRPDALHVQVVNSLVEGRAVRVGDLAVRFSR